MPTTSQLRPAAGAPGWPQPAVTRRGCMTLETVVGCAGRGDHAVAVDADSDCEDAIPDGYDRVRDAIATGTSRFRLPKVRRRVPATRITAMSAGQAGGVAGTGGRDGWRGHTTGVVWPRPSALWAGAAGRSGQSGVAVG